MQTFVPAAASFVASLSVLDNKRLGKQRVEALTIYNTLRASDRRGWYNHPAVRMWRGHEFALLIYGVTNCELWKSRGFVDNISNNYYEQLQHFADQLKAFNTHSTLPLPSWWGDERVHSSHRAALLAKNYEHYSQFGWTEAAKLDYFWPTQHPDYAECIPSKILTSSTTLISLPRSTPSLDK